MKREILLSFGILFCVNSFAQNITITDHKIKEENDKVFVTFTISADKIKSNERLTLTPVLYNGGIAKNLNPIMITGRKRSVTDKRTGRAIGIRTMDNQHIPYRVTVPYESWMSDVSLRIDRKIESCCTEQMLASREVVKEKPIRYDVIEPKIEPIQPELSPLEKIDIEQPFLAPMKEYAAFKDNFEAMRAEGALIVRFRQGKTAIDLTFEDNAKSLEQMRKVLDLIEQDPNASLGKIVLAGASSMEGSVKINDLLAQKRVESLRRYLGDKISSRANLFEGITIGEDWVGLHKMVEESSMQYKEEVLKIIDNVPVSQGREVKLMNLKWGRPYNYMLEHFFPKLRSAGYIRIFYESKPSVEFEKTNEAIELYNNKKYLDALTRLEGVKTTATTENIRGVCYMMLGEYNRAQTALDKAKEMGNRQAAESLEQLKKRKAIEQ